MFCPVCGTKVGDNARYCTGCGASLGALHQGGVDASAQVNQVEAYNLAHPANPASFGSPAPAPRQLRRSSMLDFFAEKRRIGNRLVPTFALIIASFIAAAGIAYAAFMLYKNVVEPRIQRPIQQEQVAEAGGKDEQKEKSSEQTVSYSTQQDSITVSVPEDPYYREAERRDWTWTYPQLKADGNQDTVKKINETIKSSMQADADRADGMSANTDRLLSESLDGVCVVRNIEITYMDDSVVCMRDSRYDTAYGAHGLSSVFGIAFDLKTGKVIDAASLFGLSGSSLRDATVNAVVAYISDKNLIGSDFSSEETGERCTGKAYAPFSSSNVIEGSTPYYVTDQGLVYRTQSYELTGVYADGNADVIVAAWKDDSLVGTGADVEYKTFQDMNAAYSSE